jgi:hypothetical protein
MSEPSTSEEGTTFDAEGTAPAAAKPASRWEDFVDIFYAPSSVFARREHSGFGIPLLVCTVLIGVISVANMGVLQPILDAEFGRNMAAAMKANPNLTAESMQKMRGVGESIAKIGSFIGTPIAIFFVGLFLWVAGKLVGARTTLAAALMVAAYAWVIRVVQSVLYGVEGLLMDPAALNGQYRLSFSPARFLDPDVASPLLIAVLGRFDIFTIWVTVLLGIGLAVTGKISRQKAFLAAALVWLLGGLPAILQAARQ